jgi:Flp pilus assembly protein TadG
MPRTPHTPPRTEIRTGSVAVEMAILLPFLAFCFIAGVDYCRVFYYVQAVQNAASTGAMWGCQDSTTAVDTATIKSTALADATNLSPAPNITSTTGTDSDGNPTVSVTASYTFKTLTNYPGIPSSTTITRTVTMRVCPGQAMLTPGGGTGLTGASGGGTSGSGQ